MARLANRRLDAVLVADMRSLSLAPERLGGLIAFYSLIHVRRPELRTVLREFHRALQPGGRVLFSAHEGQGEVEREQFLEDPVPFVATLFELDELVDASRAAGLTVSLAERRTPYPSESARSALRGGDEAKHDPLTLAPYVGLSQTAGRAIAREEFD